MEPRLYPLFADIKDRPVLVVGGGAVALRKIAALRGAGARVRVGAPRLDPRLQAQAAAGAIKHLAGEFDPAWLDEAWLAIAATDDREVNRRVAEAGAARRIFVNVVDDAELSSYQVPSVVERGPLQVAISSRGAAPMLARHLREQLEAQLDASLGVLAGLLARHRARIRAKLPVMAERRRWFDALLHGVVPGLLRRNQPLLAERELLASLSSARDSSGKASPQYQGSVALVGAGPGDAGLLTLRGLRLLNEADVILHDRLVSRDVLALARRDAEFIEVGKEAGCHHVTQDGIHALMREHANAGRRVVRLKGGDPFVFGRGGEELEFLREHGIACEVVPGITAALACAAYAGVPLTHRDHADSLRLLTAHSREGADEPDWASLAAGRQTLAVYMGVTALPRLQAKLLEHGCSPDTPFALVENGSRPEQRVIAGPLSALAARAREHGVQSPALLIVGEVAALAETLHWHGERPLTTSTPGVLRPAA